MIKREVIYLPRPATNFPGCFPLHFEKHIPELLESSNFIHVFSGSSVIGHTVDINAELNPDTIADAHSLPFDDETFEGGFADPPYTKEFANRLYNCKYPKWSIWTNELVRVVKKGGMIGIMQNYIVPRLKGCQYERIVVILTRIKQYPRIVTIQRKEAQRE